MRTYCLWQYCVPDGLSVEKDFWNISCSLSGQSLWWRGSCSSKLFSQFAAGLFSGLPAEDILDAQQDGLGLFEKCCMNKSLPACSMLNLQRSSLTSKCNTEAFLYRSFYSKFPWKVGGTFAWNVFLLCLQAKVNFSSPPLLCWLINV